MALKQRPLRAAVVAGHLPLPRPIPTARCPQERPRRSPTAMTETARRLFRERTPRRSSRQSDRTAWRDSARCHKSGISEDPRPISDAQPHSADPERNASEPYLRGHEEAGLVAPPLGPPAGKPRGNLHREYPNARERFWRKAGAGTTFPTVSAGVRRESTRRANRLCHRSLGSILGQSFTTSLNKLPQWKCNSSVS